MSAVADINTASLQIQVSLHGEAVTYNDGTTDYSVTAMRGKAVQTSETPEQGLAVGDRKQDWILPAEFTLADGSTVTVTPARKHTITTASGQVFRVMPIANDSSPWRWLDPASETFRRVFTRERPA